MTIGFPNRTRSYDASGSRVRFWGHDGPMEVTFFVEEKALSKLDPRARHDELSVLLVFDIFVDRILNVATKIYQLRGRRPAYVLQSEDFV